MGKTVSSEAVYREISNRVGMVLKGAKLKSCDKNIMKAMELAEEMIALADLGDTDSEDDRCNILCGSLRDSAFQIKQIAETEKEKHIKKGSWNKI